MRKGLSYILSLLFLSLRSYCQESPHIKNPAVGISITWDDFESADFIRNYSLSQAFRQHEFAKGNYLKSGLAVSYLRGITPHLDLNIVLNGSYLDYKLRDGTQLGKGELLIETEGTVNAKIFTDNSFITPFVTAGGGISKYSKYFGAFMPVGLGIQLNFHNYAFVLINSQYRAGLSSNVNNHFYYSFGVAGNIAKRRKKKSAHPVVLPGIRSFDKDHDGVPDSVDACVDIAGLKQYNGCPDTDADGIPDNLDKCPSVAGVLRYHGCSIPDTDGDGINDENDECPSVPGVVRYHGCPVPDTDGDGINNEEDACPAIEGNFSNHGCPEVNSVIKEKIDSMAKKILFKTGSYSLLQGSKYALDYLVRILKSNPYLEVRIEGNTDNIGSKKMNEDLSEKRAITVLNYLVENGGIDSKMLSVKGWGYSNPVADNSTPEGRALNRRVEFHIYIGILRDSKLP